MRRASTIWNATSDQIAKTILFSAFHSMIGIVGITGWVDPLDGRACGHIDSSAMHCSS